MDFSDSSNLQDWTEALGENLGSLLGQVGNSLGSISDFYVDALQDALEFYQSGRVQEALSIMLGFFVRAQSTECESCITFFPTDPIMPIKICIREPECRREEPPTINIPEGDPEFPPRPNLNYPSIPADDINGLYRVRIELEVETFVWEKIPEFYEGERIRTDSRTYSMGFVETISYGRDLYYKYILTILPQGFMVNVQLGNTGWKGYAYTNGYYVSPEYWKIISDEAQRPVNIQVEKLQNGDGTPNYFPPTNQPGGNGMNEDCCTRLERRLKRIEDWTFKIGKWTGSFEGGMLVPELLHTIHATGEPQGYASRIINNIPEFYVWYIEKFQEFLGEWSFKITDDKENELTFPNVAESLKTILMKTMAQDRAIASLQQGLVKTALETALTRQEAIFGKSVSDAIADFLEIPLEEKTVEILHQFTLPEDIDIAPEDVDTDKEIEDFFTSSYLNAKIVDFDPTKKINGKKPETFGTHTKRILKILEIVLAVHSVPIDKDNIEADLRKFVSSIKKFSKGEALDGRTVGTDDDNDLSSYLEKVETMFSGEENAPTDASITPWGNSLEERPRFIVRGVPPTEGDDMGS